MEYTVSVVDMRRRTYLGLIGASALAGCLGDDDSEESTDNGTTDPSAENGSQSNSDTGGSGEDDGSGADSSPSFERVWSQSLESSVINAVNYDVALTDDGLFAGSEAGLVAFERADGADRWARERPAEYETVLADAGTVAALSKDGELLVINPADGSVRWREEISGPTARIAMNNEYVFSGGRENVTAHDSASGEQRWQVSSNPQTVVATDEYVVISSGGPITRGYDTTGELRWEQEVSADPGGTISDGTYVAPSTTFDDTVVALDMASGERRWTVEDITLSAFSRLDASEGVLAVYDELDPFKESDETALRTYAVEDGTLMWETTLGSVSVPFRPPAAGSELIVAETSEGIGAFDFDSGEKRAETTGPSLVMDGLIDEGRFFACSGDVVAYDL
jgi:outer membrane protein assembly factor BamB